MVWRPLRQPKRRVFELREEAIKEEDEEVGYTPGA